MNKASLTAALMIGAVAVGVAVVLGMNNTPSPSPDDSSLFVAATIFPLADIVQNIAGDHVNVVLVVPPGVSEHDFNISPQQIVNLQSTDVLFQIGQGLDDALVERIQGAIGDELRVQSVEQGISLREFGEEEEEHEEEERGEEEDEHGHGSVDPHYWLSVPNAKMMAANIANVLAEIDPERASEYQQNLDDYLAELDALEQELQATAADLQQKHFIAMHDAWGYFADHYGLELVGTYEPVEGREPSPADLQELQQVVREFGITTFYTEPQKASTPATRFFAQELGLNIEVLDPVGGTPGRQSYIELMRANVAAIARGSQ